MSFNQQNKTIHINAVLNVGLMLALCSKAKKVKDFHKRHDNVVSKMTLSCAPNVKHQPMLKH